MTPRLTPRVLAVVVGLCLVQFASAQYNTGFENVTASTGGTALNGQDKFFNPLSSSSVSFNAYTYAGNTLKVPTNPQGGKQFVAGTGPGSVNNVLTYARSERNITYVGDRYTAGFDVCVLFTGTGTPVDNIGSFSTQPYNSTATHKAFIALARWATAGSTWKVSMVVDNGAGLAISPIPDVPATGFTNLPVNKWYRWETDFCFKTNLILEVRLTDLAKKTTVKYNPTGWYLQGGSSSTLTIPTGYRLFAGSSVAGNTLCFDNVTMTLTAGAAAASNYGGGRMRTNPTGSLVITGKPAIGQTVKLGVHNPLATQKAGGPTLLALALTKTDPGAMIYGWGMRRGNGIGELLVNNLVLVFGLSPWDGNKPSELSIKVPNDCVLPGARVYFQGIIGDKGQTTAGLTEGAELLVGTR